MAIFWNTHVHITLAITQAHIATLLSISPSVTLQTLFTPTQSDDIDIKANMTMPTCAPLDTPDELTLCALLLSIMHHVVRHRDKITSMGSMWIGGVALFELAVLKLCEAQCLEHEDAAV
ncbi:hypothetical protein BJV78DRAFT_1286878 [Lactifluus subvellereus]|nr:hypothetical protein BJV78DRAFT_1286878 [Lactifluus subvellereus]